VDERGTLPLPLFAGFALACVGGPLALAALYVPDAVGNRAVPAMGLTVAAGAALFAFPLLIWWRYSGEVTSAGGLSAFVERAAGRRMALVHGAVWTLSYFLYLPFTVTYLVYDQLPESFPGIKPYQPALLGVIWPLMGLVISIGSLIYVVLTVVLSVGYVSPAATLANAWDTRMGGALADAISCNAVVKGFGAEDREEERLSHVVGKWRVRTERTWKRGTLNGGFQGATLIVLRTAIVGVAILLWQQGVAKAGDIALVLTSFFVLQGYLRDIGQHVRNLQRSVNDMEELVEVQFHPLGIEDRPDAKPAMIEEGEVRFDHVTFQYGKHSTPLYNDFSVTIPAGQRVGLVGHSGSGKTTFVKLIQRLYDVNDGAIRIDGRDIREATQASLRSQIAIVQQEPILFHRSLAENIAYARPGATRQEIIEAAKLASAHDFIVSLPKGYETLVGERGVKLSGGERQRVAIARAFLADSPILILDEATSSLDSESEVLIQKAMERLMVGRTTIVIAHRLSTVRALDRLLVFDKGRIVEEGTHEELVRRDGGIYRRLFERQALELTKGLAVA